MTIIKSALTCHMAPFPLLRCWQFLARTWAKEGRTARGDPQLWPRYRTRDCRGTNEKSQLLKLKVPRMLAPQLGPRRGPCRGSKTMPRTLPRLSLPVALAICAGLMGVAAAALAAMGHPAICKCG